MNALTRRSSRLTKRVLLKESIAEKTERDYTLNLVRALKKKAEQCSKDTKVLEERKGDNRIFSMSGGIYELYRHALIAHFEKLMADNGSTKLVKLKAVKDKQSMIVESQIRVHRKRNGGGVGDHLYTVNLYHTRSSMMVNGSEADLFTQDHKVAIDSILNISNLDTIDKELHAVLIRELDKIQINNHLIQQDCCDDSSLVAMVPDRSPSGTSQLITDTMACTDIDDGQSATEDLCLHCEEGATDGVIQCSTCENWYHYMCEGMTEEEFVIYGEETDSIYVCRSCSVGSTGLNPVIIGEDREHDEARSVTDQLQEKQIQCLVATTTSDNGNPSPMARCNRQQNTTPSILATTLDTEVPPDDHSNTSPSVLATTLADTEVPPDGQSKTNSAKSGPSSGNEPMKRAPKKTTKRQKPIHAEVGGVDREKVIVDTMDDDDDPICSPTKLKKVEDSLAEQMLKSKEKTLNARERKLKDIEKKLHLKEIGLTDQIDQSEYAKAYIVTMENKVKELENSNRLLKMKVITQAEASSEQVFSPPPDNSLEHTRSGNQGHVCPQAQDLQSRITNIELRQLEQRLSHLEQSVSYNHSNRQYWGQPLWWGDPYHNLHVQHQYYYPYSMTQPYYLGIHHHGIFHQHTSPAQTDNFQYPTTQPGSWNASQAREHPTMVSYAGASDSSTGHVEVMVQSSTDVQGSKTHTESFSTNNEQPIPVHFSCRGRRKTTRLKSQTKPKIKQGAPPNLPVRMSHTSKEQSPRATHRGRITSKQSNNMLEVPDYPQSFPSILMLNLEGNQERTKQQNSQRRMLQIPKICVMDQEKEDDVHNLLPHSTRCQ